MSPVKQSGFVSEVSPHHYVLCKNWICSYVHMFSGFFFSLFPTLATNESNIFLYIISYVGRVFVVFVMFLIVV